MVKEKFTTMINAARNAVWHVLWTDEYYRKWTAVFSEGSYAESDWNEGSEIKFLAKTGSGMYSMIEKKSEPDVMSFKHIGEIKDGEKQPPGSWSGAKETYFLKDVDGKTELTVEMDITEEYMSYFKEHFPKAIAVIKELAESNEIKTITIEADVNAPLDKVWKYWTDPAHVMKWNNASDDWHCPRAENDVRTGGKFKFNMAAKNGTMDFDFIGDYTNVIDQKLIVSKLGDGRDWTITFEQKGSGTKVTEVFEPENVFPLSMQRMGWQNILNNFKKHTETN